MLKNLRLQPRAAGEAPVDDNEDDSHELQTGVVLSIAPRQEKAMETMQSTPPASTKQTAGSGERRDAVADTVVFKVRYGRCALALVGLLLLLTAAVTGILRIFDIVSAWLPVFAILGATGSFFLLRRLAIRDRRTRMNAAFRSAMAPVAEQERESARVVVRPQTEIFDAEAQAREARRLTAVELRKAALKVAEAAGDTTVQSPAAPEDTAWEPVEVPKPTYVDAAKAPRPTPEPLDLPEAPKPLGKPSLKQASTTPAAPVAQPQQAKVQGGMGNLDDVLQRRRA
ncbi:hypothetical protein AB6813_12155 [bacterium RCC_150]